jgi:hypothetical protein
MTVSDEIDQYIAENGGNARDALNVALARIAYLEEVTRITNDMALSVKEDVSIIKPMIVEMIEDSRALKVNYDALVYQLRERDEFCQSQGPANCPLKVHIREGMGNL